jgi:hypothetical protein
MSRALQESGSVTCARPGASAELWCAMSPDQPALSGKKQGVEMVMLYGERHRVTRTMVAPRWSPRFPFPCGSHRCREVGLLEAVTRGQYASGHRGHRVSQLSSASLPTRSLRTYTPRPIAWRGLIPQGPRDNLQHVSPRPYSPVNKMFVYGL